MLFMTTLSPSYHFKKKDMGYAKMNKRHGQESMMKKKREVGHMKVQVKKIEIAHVQRKRGERQFMKGVHNPSTQKSTHMHILIKVYDLFLLRIRSLT